MTAQLSIEATGQRRFWVSTQAETRSRALRAHLAGQPRDARILVVSPSWDAGHELCRGLAVESGARFGLERQTLDRVAARWATPALLQGGVRPATRTALLAVVARAAHGLAGQGGLSMLGPLEGGIGFAQAALRTIEELRASGVSAEALTQVGGAQADLARLLTAVEEELAQGQLADRAAIYASATSAIETADAAATWDSLVFFDLPVASPLEARLLRNLTRLARDVLATAPLGDERAVARLRRIVGVAEQTVAEPARSAAGRLQAHLFGESPPEESVLDDSVTVTSWPGEARECVELARRAQVEAGRGIRFDQMAVVLRSPGEYRAHVEEAFRRAAIPVYFSRGARRPEAAGRAFLVLLECAAERLSARRFAEYVSLGQVADPGRDPDREAGWVAPQDDLLPLRTGSVVAAEPDATEVELPTADPEAQPVVAGAVRAPWRWERLLVDAAVIGSQQRWEKRLSGLRAELAARLQHLGGEEEGRAAQLQRQIDDLDHLTTVAIPIVSRLAALPHRAQWSEWLDHLRGLAVAALRRPDKVLAKLAELAPMGPVGPVDLAQVQLVLGPLLSDLIVPHAGDRGGAVFVGSPEEVRGLSFDVVLVPGLGERLFPRKVAEDPLFPDRARVKVSAELETQSQRVLAERLGLRLAVGASRGSVHLSYPRIDLEQARPRLPSFYALDALRAAQGRLPKFDELIREAEQASGGRTSWFAPRRAEEAIDEAEYDIAVLGPLVEADPEQTVGAARYLLEVNSHLGRALRARARRWKDVYTVADGLVNPEPWVLPALERHQMGARSFSPTALENYASCPYRFLLQAVHRLAPREEAEALETMDALTKGALFHDVQAALMTELRDTGLLPVRPENLEEARAVLDATFAREAARYKENLFPAIERVWDDALDGLRADLRELLQRDAQSSEGWVPHRFELSFGLADRDRTYADEQGSVAEPVALAGGLLLRGSIDLVERQAARAELRVTDYKTGKARAPQGMVVGGGKHLQPVLYALTCEKLLDEPVTGGRLYYCTADGGFEERSVPLDALSREAAQTVTAIVAGSLHEGFFPAAPAEGACRFCDYRPVCGPHEEVRTERKKGHRLADLKRLRELP